MVALSRSVADLTARRRALDIALIRALGGGYQEAGDSCWPTTRLRPPRPIPKPLSKTHLKPAKRRWRGSQSAKSCCATWRSLRAGTRRVGEEGVQTVKIRVA